MRKRRSRWSRSPSGVGGWCAGATAVEPEGNVRMTPLRHWASLAAVALAAVVIVCSASAVSIGGTNGADILRGTSGPDRINGKGGADRIYGLGGSDVLVG